MQPLKPLDSGDVPGLLIERILKTDVEKCEIVLLAAYGKEKVILIL